MARALGMRQISSRLDRPEAAAVAVSSWSRKEAHCRRVRGARPPGTTRLLLHRRHNRNSAKGHARSGDFSSTVTISRARPGEPPLLIVVDPCSSHAAHNQMVSIQHPEA